MTASKTLRRTVTTSSDAATVFAYLADFTNTTEWDPGTVECVRTAGDGGPGTTYRNVSKFAGNKTELTYTVLERVEGRRLVLRGVNNTVEATDTMELEAEGGGTRVVYTAEFEFKGAFRWVALALTPVLAVAFKRLGDEAEEGLREALGRL